MSQQFLEGRAVRKKEVEGTVEYFPRVLIARNCGVAKAPDGKNISIAARDCADGFNGHRSFTRKGRTVIATVVPDGDGYLATSWRDKK